VLAVRKDSDADKLGLRANDVIVKINATPVERVEDVGAAIRPLAKDAPLTLEVVREGKHVTLAR
jgi:S1-C subfamily serine protease